MSTETPSSRFAQRLQASWLVRDALARFLLPLAFLYGAVHHLRRFAYRVGLFRSQRLPVPVIVVGNMIVGGAGKTPTVLALVDALRRQGRRPGIVSRGYGGRRVGALEITRAVEASRSGDEPLMLHLRSGAPVVVGRDRVAAGRLLLQRHPQVDVIVSDDGLQHLAMARDVQVIVFDERGVGNGWLLPAGPMREALPRSVPGRSLVVYNGVAPSTSLPGTVAVRSLTSVVPLASWWQGEAASSAALAALRGGPLVAAAGVARPDRFFSMLREQGLEIEPLALPDHHDYAALPWPAGCSDVIVTEKDAVKLDPSRVGVTRVWVAPLDFALGPAFETALGALLPPTGLRHGNTSA